jgi:hypothetical protein
MALSINFASPNYANAVELAVGPVLFMSVSMLLNTTISTRLAQVMDRAKFLRSDNVRHDEGHQESEFATLMRRARLLHWAIRASSLGALMFALVITLSFFTAFLQVDLSLVLAGCFVTALLALVTALFTLLREADVALNNLRL